MKKRDKAKITATRVMRLPLMAFAAQKCELQPENIMIGVLALAAENPAGLTADQLNGVLFGGARIQLAEQLLNNGLATCELRREGDRYFLTEYGQTDLGNGEAWVNETTASWELLCLGAALGSEVDGLMRLMDDRVKLEAGWRKFEECDGIPTFDSATQVWEKISSKAQLKVLMQEAIKGVLLVDEFKEPPKSSSVNVVLARSCTFEVILEKSLADGWTIARLDYKAEVDTKFSQPFVLPAGVVRVDGPSDEAWREALKRVGVQVDSDGSIYCIGNQDLEADFANLIIPTLEFGFDEWLIRMEDVPLRSRNREEALEWFARYLAVTSGKNIASWGEVKVAAKRYLKKAGCESQEITTEEAQLTVQSALGLIGCRGDASRLGYILDFET